VLLDDDDCGAHQEDEREDDAEHDQDDGNHCENSANAVALAVAAAASDASSSRDAGEGGAAVVVRRRRAVAQKVVVPEARASVRIAALVDLLAPADAEAKHPTEAPAATDQAHDHERDQERTDVHDGDRGPVVGVQHRAQVALHIDEVQEARERPQHRLDQHHQHQQVTQDQKEDLELGAVPTSVVATKHVFLKARVASRKAGRIATHYATRTCTHNRRQ